MKMIPCMRNIFLEPLAVVVVVGVVVVVVAALEVLLV
jgi:hypothetical protein